jgi:hypothetical protein
MASTSKKIKTTMRLGELIQIAKDRPNYDPKIHNSKETLLNFLRPDKKPTKKDLLIAEAQKISGFKKSEHGKNVKTLKAFIDAHKNGGVVQTKTHLPPVAVSTWREVEALDFQSLKKLAKERGWDKGSKGKKHELLEFLRPIFEKTPSPQTSGPLPSTPPPPPEEKEEVDWRLVEWPIPDDVVNGASGNQLLELLESRGIRVAVPRNNPKRKKLFKKKRCDTDHFVCDESEFCDLRNHLCLDLTDLKVANGNLYYDEKGHRFLGSKEAIAEVKRLLRTPPPPEVIMDEEEEEEIIPEDEELLPAPTIDPDKCYTCVTGEETPVQETPSPEQKTPTPEQKTPSSVQAIPSPEIDNIRSPININNLLEKPSEQDIRRTILKCLGLYNDLDPNDEIMT